MRTKERILKYKSLGLDREWLTPELEKEMKENPPLTLSDLSVKEKKELAKEIFYRQIENVGYGDEESKKLIESELPLNELLESEKGILYISQLFGTDREYIVYEPKAEYWVVYNTIDSWYSIQLELPQLSDDETIKKAIIKYVEDEYDETYDESVNSYKVVEETIYKDDYDYDYI